MSSSDRPILPGLRPDDRPSDSEGEARAEQLAWLEGLLPEGPLWLLDPSRLGEPLLAGHPGSLRVEGEEEAVTSETLATDFAAAVLLFAGAPPLEDERFWQALERRLAATDARRVVVADRFRTLSWRESAGDAVNRSRYLTALAAAGFRIQRSHDLTESDGALATSEGVRCRVDELRWDGYRIRTYREGDEAAILELFERCFHRSRGEEHWRWKYRDNPWGKEHITLVFSPEGPLVGQYCAYPAPFAVVDGRQLEVWRALQIGDTMVAPEARSVGRGPTSLLARATRVFFARFCEGEVAFDYGVNTGGIHRYYLRFVGGHLVEPVAYRQRAADRGASVPRPSPWARRRLRIERIDTVADLDDSFDRLVPEVAPDYRLFVWRDRRYLRWRYLQCPDAAYSLYAAWRGRKLLGWSVFHLRPEEPDRPAALVWGDALYRRRDRSVALAVLDRALAEHPQVPRLEAWFPERPDWWQQVLERAGLVHSDEPNDLRLIMLPFERPESLERVRRDLYYTSGDTDLF